jgi:hypothetical protein
MSSTEQDEAFLRSVIETFNNHWAATSEPLLLSRLGQMLSQRGIDLQGNLRGRKLSDVIKEQLSAHLRVSPIGPGSKVWAVVPASDTPSAAPTPKLVLSFEKKEHIPRVDSTIWAAFSRALAPDHSRILEFDPEPVFRDVAKDLIQDSGPLITADNVAIKTAEQSSSEYYREVYSKLRDWLDANGVPFDKVRANSHPMRGKQTGTVLDQLIEKLTPEQLRRVAIPLDVLASLLKK